MKTILTILILLLPILSKEKNTKNVIWHYKSTTTVYQVLNFIKSHENPRYTGKIHSDGNGNKTIGYGHLLLKNDTFIYLDSIGANKLLNSDFNKARNRCLDLYPTLNYSQHLSVSHIIYALGENRALKLVKNGKLDTIKLKSYCKIKNKIHPLLVKQREFEIKTFYE